MADQIFTGSGFKLFYNNDTANRIPDNAGNELVNELAAMPSFGIDSQVQTIEVYNSEFSEKLLAEQNVNNVDIVVNYVPDCTAHAFLDQATEDQTEFQLTLQYDVSDGIISYSMVNGMISSARLAGDKDAVVTKTYTFTPTDVLVRDGQAPLSTGLVVGSYGVGSNGVDVPQYEPELPNGNSFIKVPAARIGNPASADLMGIGLVDSGTFSSIAMSKSGTLAIYAKNQNTAWTRILTATQISDQYVPLTRTINGKALNANITLTKADVGLSNVTNDAQLKAASNLSDVANVATARTNLKVARFEETRPDLSTIYSTDDKSGYKVIVRSDGYWGAMNADGTVTKGLSIDMGGTGANTLAQAQANLGIVTSAAQDGKYLAKASNLSDLPSKPTARTNLGLGTAATYNVSSSGANVPLMSSANTWSGIQYFGNAQFTSTYTNPLLIHSSTPTIYLKDTDTSGLGMKLIADGSVFRMQDDTSDETWAFSYNYNTKVVTLPSLQLSTKLAVAEGGTGASTWRQAAYNLNVMPYNRNSLTATDNLNNFGGLNAGVYFCASSAFATPANNYPEANAGTVVVYQNAANSNEGCTQFYYPFNTNKAYKRILRFTSPTTSTWSTWAEILTSEHIVPGNIPRLTGGNTWNGNQSIDTGYLTVGLKNTTATAFEIGSQTTKNSAYIDFHTSGLSNDYDTRIIAETTTSTANGQGKLSFVGGEFNFNNNITGQGNITANAFISKTVVNATGAISGASLNTGSGAINGGAITGTTLTTTGAAKVGSIDSTGGLYGTGVVQANSSTTGTYIRMGNGTNDNYITSDNYPAGGTQRYLQFKNDGTVRISDQLIMHNNLDASGSDFQVTANNFRVVTGGNGLQIKNNSGSVSSYLSGIGSTNSREWYIGKGGSGKGIAWWNDMSGGHGMDLGADGNITLNTLASTGNVNVRGTMSTTGRLSVTGDVTASGTVRTTTTIAVNGTSGTSNAHLWYYGHTGNSRGVIYAGSNGVINFRPDRNDAGGSNGYSAALDYTGKFTCMSLSQTSDQRAKYDAADISNSLGKVLQLTGKTYKMKVTPDVEVDGVGFFAQEVEKFFPEAVSSVGSAYTKEGEEIENPLGLDYQAISVLYAGAIKELNAKVEDQQLQLDELRAVVTQILIAQNK
ncbi:TPA: tail fiber domain-containing protein [Escherichia coli]|nr:pyocin knob domain-containing S74 family peptidase [Escherichia coli]QMG44847.1 tail fiber domain-containing protein [Escherichia coli]